MKNVREVQSNLDSLSLPLIKAGREGMLVVSSALPPCSSSPVPTLHSRHKGGTAALKKASRVETINKN